MVEDIVEFARGEDGHEQHVMEIKAFDKHPHEHHRLGILQEGHYHFTENRLKADRETRGLNPWVTSQRSQW